MEPSIEQLKAFVEVVRSGSFTQAAKQLRKAKSAVRYSVGGLEEQLGTELFDRKTYRPSLTRIGSEIYKQSERLLRQYEEFSKHCDQIRGGVEHRLSISISDIYGTTKVLSQVQKLMSVFPQTEIILEREILSGEKMLLDKTVDIGIFEGIKNKDLIEHKKIFQTELLTVLHKDHHFFSLPKKEQLENALLSYPQIIQRSTLPTPESPGVVKNSRLWKVTDTLAKKELILSGLGWGRLPKHVIQKEIENGELRPISDTLPPFLVDIHICRRKGEKHGKVSTAFWDMVGKLSITKTQ